METDRRRSNAYASRAVQVGAHCFLGGIVLAYAGLAGLGQWGGDEFSTYYRMRTTHFFFLKRLEWSPRPISESILYLYGWAVNHFHRPLIVPLLGLFWAVFLFTGLFTYWQKRRQPQAPYASVYLLLGLVLMALFLAGGKPAEVFYWPFGTAAYLLTLSATLLLFLQVVGGALSTSQGRMVAGICLVAAAWSSESGATFVACYAGLQLALWGWARFRSRGEEHSRPVLWWGVPALFALMALLVVRLFRFYVPEFANAVNTGRPFASLIASFREIAVEALGQDLAHQLRIGFILPGLRFPLGILFHSRLAMEILLAVGIALCCSRLGRISKERAGAILSLVAALLLASLFTIAAALMHFGQICCDRHATLREAWAVMCVAGVVIASSAWVSAARFHRGAKYFVAGPVLLCASVLCVLPTRPLLRLYRNYPAVWRADEENFQSGFRVGETQMHLFAPPAISLVDDDDVIPGVYTKKTGGQPALGEDTYIDNLLDFFGKTSVVVDPMLTDAPASEIP